MNLFFAELLRHLLKEIIKKILC